MDTIQVTPEATKEWLRAEAVNELITTGTFATQTFETYFDLEKQYVDDLHVIIGVSYRVAFFDPLFRFF